MYLNMDKNGNVYQSAQHRSDGMGYEKGPEQVDYGDVSLGNVYQNAENKRQETWNTLNQMNGVEKLQEERNIKELERHEFLGNLQEQRQINHERNPAVQDNLKYEAAKQYLHGADYDQLKISGYGKSAYGMEGPSRQDKARWAAVQQSMGNEPSDAESSFVHDVSDEEQHQYMLEQEFERQSSLSRQEELLNADAPLNETNNVEDAELPPIDAELTPPGIQRQMAEAEAAAREAEAQARIAEAQASKGIQIDFKKLLTPRNVVFAGIAYLVLFRK